MRRGEGGRNGGKDFAISQEGFIGCLGVNGYYSSLASQPSRTNLLSIASRATAIGDVQQNQ